MADYQVTHLQDKTIHARPATLINPSATNTTDWQQQKPDPEVETFHKALPDYGETKLHPLPTVASELGLKHVFLKDESTRFALPSFKILGASWAIHRTLCQHLSLPPSTPIHALKTAIHGPGATLSLVTTTDGNWGRACARTAAHLSIPLTLHVPSFMPPYTQNLIRSEGATVNVLPNSSYDDCIAHVRSQAAATGALMVLDTSWPGYEEIPQWVTDGYETMLAETDRQVALATQDAAKPNLLFASVGVGSWAHSVVSHYKAADPAGNRIVTVEPDSAAAFKESLHCGQITPVETGDTIMCGMNCGTTSTIAWPVLRDGVFAATTVTDRESHEDVVFLQRQGVDAGPCGAANLAALRKFCASGLMGEGEKAEAVVVLFSTEGNREYEIPK
ncbi:hypothetical protein MBLNU230_g0849t1 [Neophaeotheca triangularis]